MAVVIIVELRLGEMVKGDNEKGKENNRGDTVNRSSFDRNGEEWMSAFEQ